MADQKHGVQEIADADIEIFHDLGKTPSIFMDGAQGFSVVNGTAKLHLFQLVQHFEGAATKAILKKVIVGQLILPPPVVGVLARWLAERAKELEVSQVQEGAEVGKSSDGGQ